MRYLTDTDHRFFTGIAQWIWSDEGVWGPSPDPRPIQVRWFAREIDFPYGGSVVLAISADTRYMLYLNGSVVARGPQKGDVAHQFYDVLDLSDDMRFGRNLLLVRVDSNARSFPYYFRTGPAASEMSAATIFAADGEVCNPRGKRTESLATGDGWKVRVDPALSFEHDDEQSSYVGFKEAIHLGRLPAGFHDALDFSDGSWRPATVVHAAFTPENAQDAFLPHRLLQRSIKPLKSTSQPIVALREIREGNVQPTFANGILSVTIPARSRWRGIVDAGVIRTAYPELAWHGGDGAKMNLKYAECLFRDGKKTHRDEVAGCDVVGYSDRITIGNGHGSWTPMHWRAFRFLELSIETGAEDLRLERLALTDCHYPLAPVQEFRCSDPILEKMWAIGVRTQQACAHDTFEDCPYYEQLQYGGDTQLQIAFSEAMSGDTSLALQALRFFHWSMTPEGLTQSRYPSRPTQIIPFFSLHYIFMLHDWLRYTGSLGPLMVEARSVTRILQWFLDRRDESWLIGKLPHWCVADWSPEWMDRFGGSVPGAKDGPCALANFMVIAALERGAEILDVVDDSDQGMRFRHAATGLRSLAETAFWDEGRGLYRDAGHLDCFSQLTNAWALLIDLPYGSRRDAIAERLADPQGLCRAAYFGHAFLFEAWAKCRRPDLIVRSFSSYRDLVAQGVTTWPENPGDGRSECHAWSNAASYHLLRTVLGFSILEPGCKRMAIAPFVDGLDQASGAFVTPHGPVSVDFSRGRNPQFVIAVPEGVIADFRFSGLERSLPAGRHQLG